MYSDASHAVGVRTRLGWVLFTNNAEAFAVLAAIWQHRDLLTGKVVIFFVDNEAAASAMIKGHSRLLVVGTMAMCVHLLLIRYNIAVWFEWVDSDSNLADGLSRDCLEDPWTLDHEFQGLPFAVSLVSLREQFFLILLTTDLSASAGMCAQNLLLGVLHPGVPVMWHTHIRDLSPTAKAVRGAVCPR